MKHTVFQDIIEQINNPSIAAFVKECLKDVPDELETMPTSTSGKYHPPEANQEGGLVWHIRRGCWFAFQFIQAYKWEKDDIRGDIVLAAIILHDIGKRSQYKNYWEYVDHPKTAAKMISRHKKLLPEKVFKLIHGCVLHHMGPFGGKFFMKPIKDYNVLELIVYNSDYLSSLKTIKVGE